MKLGYKGEAGSQMYPNWLTFNYFKRRML